jgi:hypothetical protein
MDRNAALNLQAPLGILAVWPRFGFGQGILLESTAWGAKMALIKRESSVFQRLIKKNQSTPDCR